MSAAPDLDDDVMCSCAGACDHAPVLEEIVLPPTRPLSVGAMPLDRAGLVELARRRGMGLVRR